MSEVCADLRARVSTLLADFMRCSQTVQHPGLEKPDDVFGESLKLTQCHNLQMVSVWGLDFSPLDRDHQRS